MKEQNRLKKYNLNFQKALKKKLKACEREEKIEIVQTHGGTKVLFQTGVYEIFKDTAKKFYTKRPMTTVDNIRDKAGLIVGNCIKTKTDGNDNLTVNLYHTTSSLLANGKGEIDFLNEDLPTIVSRMGDTDNLNEEIKKCMLNIQCEEQESETCTQCADLCTTSAVLCIKKNHCVHYQCEGLDKETIRKLENEPTVYRCKACTQLSSLPAPADVSTPRPDEEARTSNNEEEVATETSQANSDRVENMSLDIFQDKITESNSDSTDPEETAPKDYITTAREEGDTEETCLKQYTTQTIEYNTSKDQLPLAEDKTLPEGTTSAMSQEDKEDKQADVQISSTRPNNTEQKTPQHNFEGEALKGLEAEMAEMKMLLLAVMQKLDRMDKPTTKIDQTSQTTEDAVRVEKPATNISQASQTTEEIACTTERTTQTDPLPAPRGNTQVQSQIAAMKEKLENLATVVSAQGKSPTSYAQAADKPPIERLPSRHTLQQSPQHPVKHHIPTRHNIPQQDIWFSGPTDPLSNLYYGPIRVFDKWFDSAEHAYQFEKASYHNDRGAQREIIQAKNSREAQRSGDKIRTSAEWTNDKESIMKQILLAKAEHCPAYRQKLQNMPQSTKLHENTMHRFWGGKVGKDILGKLHLEVRSSILQNRGPQQAASPKPTQPPTTQKLTIIGDSNTRFLDPSKMSEKYIINKLATPTAQAALEQVNSISDQDIVVLHVGTNDLKHESPEETANKILKTVNALQDRGSKVIVSKLLPREGITIHNKIKHTNFILNHHLQANNNIAFTNTDAFYYEQRPNRQLFNQEYRDGRRLPLLHLNRRGIAELSRQIHAAARVLHTSTI